MSCLTPTCSRTRQASKIGAQHGCLLALQLMLLHPIVCLGRWESRKHPQQRRHPAIPGHRTTQKCPEASGAQPTPSSRSLKSAVQGELWELMCNVLGQQARLQECKLCKFCPADVKLTTRQPSAAKQPVSCGPAAPVPAELPSANVKLVSAQASSTADRLTPFEQMKLQSLCRRCRISAGATYISFKKITCTR